MKLLLALLLVANTTMLLPLYVKAQDDASELEELEKELDALEAEGGEEVGNTPNFSEQEEPEDVGTTEPVDVDKEIDDVLEDSGEDVVETPPTETTEEEIATESQKLEKDVGETSEPIEIPTDDLMDTPQPEVAEPESPIDIPGANEEEKLASPEAPAATETVSQAPEMLTPLPDEPNQQKERSIFNAYQYIKNYSNLEEAWPQASQGREAESYAVQAGDSLWDVSVTLFGNPYFWPKIWQINSGITNPHEIKPGDPLVFVEGDLQAAPQLTQGEGEATEPQEEMPAEEELLAEVPELPASEEQRPPLLEIPPSLAPWHLSSQAKDDFGNDIVSQVATKVPNVIRLTSYFVEEEPEAAGEIVEVELGTDTANLYQNVFIQSDKIGVGDTLVSYVIKNKVKDERNKLLGYAVELHGNLKVTEAVSTEKSVFKAMVTYLANPIRKGSFVTTGALPLKTINPNASISSVSTEIVGGEFDANRRVLATGSIVYLANGSDASIQEGTSLQIFKNQKVRNTKSLVENNTQVIGTMQIIDVKPSRSTAVITSSTDTIAIGDMTGTAAILSYDATETSSSPADSPSETESETESEIDEELELLDE